MDTEEKPTGPDAPFTRQSSAASGTPSPFRRRSTDLQTELPQEKRDEGFISPVRRTYRHVVCDKVTSMGELAAEAFARDPKCQASTYCHFCGADYPVADFLWEGTDEAVGS
jgi:hypothetical protein